MKTNPWPARRSAGGRRAQHGITLVETCITTVVTAVTLASAVPAFQQAREKRHLDGVAAQVATDIRHARSLAVSRHAQVRLSLHSSSAGSCYVVHTGAAADCICSATGTASCGNGAQALQVAGFEAAGPVQVQANVRSLLFDADRGTVTPAGTFRVVAPSGQAVHQVVSIMGRVRACSPAGQVLGHPAC